MQDHELQAWSLSRVSRLIFSGAEETETLEAWSASRNENGYDRS